MAQHLDLEEQEQLDQLKHFWKQYGNLVTWALIAVLGTYAGWNFYHYWQNNQAAQAAVLYDEVERVARGGDVAKLDRVLGDMKDKYAKTTYAQQATLLAAGVYFDAGKTDEAKAALTWVADTASDEGYKAVARLRLAGVLAHTKAFEDAIKLLTGSFPPSFAPLVSDRRGDVLMAMGKKKEAQAEYELAYKNFEESSDYRRLVEIKLNSLGVDPRMEPLPPSVEVKK